MPVMPFDGALGWAFLALSPVLALCTAKGVYNAIRVTRRKELLVVRDEGHDDAYRSWREYLKARGLNESFSPLTVPGERCYHYDYQVTAYVSSMPSPQFEEPGVWFDTECGVPVGRGWSVLDHFGVGRHLGKVSLCVTDRQVRLKGVGVDLRIPLTDVSNVTTACSSVMIDAVSLECPLLIDDVNGQMVRDVLYMLMDSQDLLDRDETSSESDVA